MNNSRPRRGVATMALIALLAVGVPALLVWLAGGWVA